MPVRKKLLSELGSSLEGISPVTQKDVKNMQAVEAGATAVIQPGGSIKDADVIAAADEAGIAMAFTGVRVFRH